MKYILALLVLILFSETASFAQNIEGIAYYKSFRSFDMKKDSTLTSPINDKLQADLLAQLKKQMQREYKLSFKGPESIYVIEEKLEAPKPASGSGITITMSGNTDVLYRNLKDENYITETEIMNKAFLIEDKLKKTDWKLEKETKNIGQYMCFKATYTRDEEGEKYNSATNEFDPYTKTVVTTVWYTPQIPLSHGPDEYWGLPGLVLEANEGKNSLLCYKVVLNPSEEINIEIPSNGKKVDQAEYDDISEKKQAEMREQMKDFKNGNGKSTTRTVIFGG